MLLALLTVTINRSYCPEKFCDRGRPWTDPGRLM